MARARGLPTLTILIVLVSGLAACGMTQSQIPAAEETLDVIPLPSPFPAGKTTLEEALGRRRSVREFDATPLTMAEVGQLLWAAQGITHERGLRTAPSAGALYPLEVYVALAEGVFHYDPRAHQILMVSYEDARPAVYEAALRQDAVRQAPAVFILTAVYERTAEKYGTERSPRYVHLEAGHAAQNLLLQAVAMGLGAVPIGAFEDERLQEALELPADHKPLYLIPVGHPRGSGQ